MLIASIAQLAERALRKRTVVGSIPTGGFALKDMQQFDFKNAFGCKYGIQICVPFVHSQIAGQQEKNIRLIEKPSLGIEPRTFRLQV